MNRAIDIEGKVGSRMHNNLDPIMFRLFFENRFIPISLITKLAKKGETDVNPRAYYLDFASKYRHFRGKHGGYVELYTTPLTAFSSYNISLPI